MLNHRFRRGLIVGLLVALVSISPTRAQGQISLIRDAEIEAFLRDVTGTVLDAAGLGRTSVRIYIVRDNRLNAFVAGGMNLFLNTGLLTRTEHVGQLVGVIAHEVGHIAGGHLSRVGTAQKRAAAESILAAVLGAAAAAAGAPGLGTAIIAGGQTFAQQGFFQFTRSQEQAADHAAISYLGRSGLSAQGLLEFFRILENQNVLAVSRSSPYLQTHPLTRDRIIFAENQVAAERGQVGEVPPAWVQGHARMVVKLQAFLRDPREVLQHFGDQDGELARYARAIALYRRPDLDGALVEIDGLLSEHPGDPFFHELKGQMLFENGRVDAAVGPYQASVELAPDAALLRIGLAQALIETGAPDGNRAAITHLEEALAKEPTNARGWRLLGIAQGREGLEGVSALSLAEYALLAGKGDDARLYARRAEARITPDDPAWIRLQDILRAIEES